MATKRKPRPGVKTLTPPAGLLDYGGQTDNSDTLATWLNETSTGPDEGFTALDTPQWEPGQPIQFDEHANPVE